MIEQMSPLECAAFGELNEGNAYAALLAGSATASVHALGSALALVAAEESRSTLLNRVIGLGLDRPIAAADLEAIAKLYGPTRNPWSIELPSACSTPDVLALLKQSGYRRSGLQAAVFAADCRELAEVASRFDIRCNEAQMFAAAADIQASVFGVSPSVRALLAQAPADGRFHQFIALDDGRPAAACLSFISAETAWAGWDATLPAHRGRGIQKALIAARARGAAAAGCRWITSETAVGTSAAPDRSHQNYLKLGFRELYRRQSYLHLPART